MPDPDTTLRVAGFLLLAAVYLGALAWVVGEGSGREASLGVPRQGSPFQQAEAVLILWAGLLFLLGCGLAFLSCVAWYFCCRPSPG